MLPRGRKFSRGRVIGWKRNVDNNLTGGAHANPILDTQEYQVDFVNGEVSEMTANVIAESIYASCIYEGNEYILMESLVDYSKNDNTMSVAYHRSVLPGRAFMRKYTAGLQICAHWKDRSTSCKYLKDLKESQPV